MVSLLCGGCPPFEPFVPELYRAGYFDFSVNDLTNDDECELMFHSNVSNYQMGTFHISFLFLIVVFILIMVVSIMILLIP